ncbi:hypothetical protein ACS0TY_024901 [Phlomoides rotata]
MVGAVLHCLNLRLDVRTISVILHHAQSKLVFVDCQSESVIIEVISLFPPDSERPLRVFIADNDVQSTPSLKTEFFATYEAMMLNGYGGHRRNQRLRKFDVSTIYAAIRKHHVTHMCGAPMVLNLLCNVPDGKPLEKPVCILTDGAPPPEAVLFRTESLGFIVSHAIQYDRSLLSTMGRSAFRAILGHISLGFDFRIISEWFVA